MKPSSIVLALALALVFPPCVAQAGLVTDKPFSYPGTEIDQQPVTDFTPTAWSAATISSYYTDFSTGIAINQNTWTPALFTINSNAPDDTVYSQTLTNGTWSVANVPVPAALITLSASRQAAGDTDNSFCLYDSYKNIVYIATGVTANAVAHTITPTAVGAYKPTGSGWWDIVYPSNITAAGPAGPQLGGASGHTCGGLIEYSQVQNNTINHALRFAWPNGHVRGSTEQPRYVYPGTVTDGTGTHGVGVDAPMGARLVVDPTLTDAFLISTYGFNSKDLAVIHALQKYGAYLSDSDGTSSMSLQAAACGQTTNFYGFGAWPATFLRDHMWFVGGPFPVPLDNRFRDNLMTY